MSNSGQNQEPYPHQSLKDHGVGPVLRYASAAFGLLAVVSALTIGAAAVLQRLQPNQVNWVVWLRSIAYTLGGIWMLVLVRAARRRRSRAAFVRLRLVSILATVGILALIISPDSGYPAWMKVEQGFFGLLLLPLAISLALPKIAAEFPKAAKSER